MMQVLELLFDLKHAVEKLQNIQKSENLKFEYRNRKQIQKRRMR